MNDPTRLGDLLGAAAKAFGVEDPAAVSALWRRWTEVVGASIAAHAEPTSLRDGVLKVRVDSPVWATEINYLAEEIRAAIENELGAGSVRSLSVWTGPAPSRSGVDPAVQKPSGPSTEGASDQHADVSPTEALERARTAWTKDRGEGRSRGPRNQENPR